MASVPSDRSNGLDDFLFEMYKEELLKHLRSKMTPEMMRVVATLKEGGASSSEVGSSKLKVQSFLASMISGEGVHYCEVTDKYLSELNCRLTLQFGSVMPNEVIAGIVGLFALGCSKTPSMLEQCEKLLFDLLKFLVDSSYIKLDGCEVTTPQSKRKEIIDKSLEPPAKRLVKKSNAILQHFDVDARVLFPEVEEIHVIDASSKNKKEAILPPEGGKGEDGVIFLKEVTLKDKINTMCKSSDALYNKNMVSGKKVDEGGPSIVDNGQSLSLLIVSEDRYNADAVCAEIPDSTRFPLSPREKLIYNVVCSLAHTKHARSTVVDIGGCNLRFFSLAESMALGNEVCTFVINALCRKYFLDERPNISRKHYFFSCVVDVFLGESTDYSYVQKSFDGAASVVPLPFCHSIFFPVLYDKHWFLFVVDLKNKFFMILDSYYSIDDEFSKYTRNKLRNGFCRAWQLCIGSTARFNEFRIAYPRVPKQQNKFDCGIYLIKFMELWTPGCKMHELFSPEDIPSNRVQILNDIVFCKHNTTKIKVVKDLVEMGATMA